MTIRSKKDTQNEERMTSDPRRTMAYVIVRHLTTPTTMTVYIHLHGGLKVDVHSMSGRRLLHTHVQWARDVQRDVPKRSCDDDGTSYPRMPFLCSIVFGG
ncbi:hypothetical protein E2C01_062007 [Portunus trituberculatus]|uniref:Uncharacterized protein n=1 Tax=Portunus trituberculatus TaxID=210409 RepID=A0A5B7H6S4_PORTR|nr:hypothetical protein [Portunus trituberculatus]